MFNSVKKHRASVVIVSFAMMFCFCLLGLFENLSINVYAAETSISDHIHISSGNIQKTEAYSDTTKYYITSTGEEYNGYISSSPSSDFSIPLSCYHVHNGNPQEGGTCYSTPVYHKHDISCYNGDYCNGLYEIYGCMVTYANNKYTVDFVIDCAECEYRFTDTITSSSTVLAAYQNTSFYPDIETGITEQYTSDALNSIISILDYTTPDTNHLPISRNGDESSVTLDLICGKETWDVDYYDLTCTQNPATVSQAYGLNGTASSDYSSYEKYEYLSTKIWYDETDDIYAGYISDTRGGCFHTEVHSYHEHQGDTINGGACYTPIYHIHTDDCYVTTSDKVCSQTLSYSRSGNYIGSIEPVEYTSTITYGLSCAFCDSKRTITSAQPVSSYSVRLSSICTISKCSNYNEVVITLWSAPVKLCNNCSERCIVNQVSVGDNNLLTCIYYCTSCRMSTSLQCTPTSDTHKTRYYYNIRYYCSRCQCYVYDVYCPYNLDGESYNCGKDIPDTTECTTLSELIQLGYTSKTGTEHNCSYTLVTTNTSTKCGKNDITSRNPTVEKYELSCGKTSSDIEYIAYACDCDYTSPESYADFTDSKYATLSKSCPGRYVVYASSPPGLNDSSCRSNHMAGCENNCYSASCDRSWGADSDSYGTYRWYASHYCNGIEFNRYTYGSRYATRHTRCNVCKSTGNDRYCTSALPGYPCSRNSAGHYIQGTTDGTTACYYCGVRASSLYLGACTNTDARTYNVRWNTTINYISVNEETINNYNVTTDDCEFICSYNSTATVSVNSLCNYFTKTDGSIVGYAVIQDGRIVKKVGKTSQYAMTDFSKCLWTGQITGFTTLQFHIYTTAGDYYLPEINLIAKYYNMDYNYHGGRAGEKAPSKIGWSASGFVSIPYNDGFSFVGWDVDNCDEGYEHYWSQTSKATTSSSHTMDTFINYKRIQRAMAFLNLRSDIGETVYLDAYWRDDNPPVWSDTEPIEPDNKDGDGKGIQYYNEDGTAYTPDTWTKQTVKVVASAHDMASGIYGFKWVVDSVNLLTDNRLVENALTYNRLTPIRTVTEYPNSSISKSGDGIIYSHKENRVYEETGEYSGTVYAKDNAEDLDFYARDGHENFYLSNGKFNESEIDFGRVRIDKTVPEYKVEYYVKNQWVENGETYTKWIKKDDWTEEGGTWTNNEVIVRVTATDVHSGLHATAFSWDQGKTWIAEDANSGTERNDTGSWVQAHTTKTFTKNTKSTVWVKDAVGNIVVVDYEVDGIDVQAPVVYPEKKPTDSDVDGEPLPKDDDETVYEYPEETQYTFDKVDNSLTYDWVNYNVVLQFNAKDEDDRKDKNGYNISRVREVRLYEADDDFNFSDSDIVKSVKGDPQVFRDPDDEEQSAVQLSYECEKQGILHYVLEAEDNAGNITTLKLTVKIDKTKPIIPEGENGAKLFDIEDINLDKYGIDEVEAKIKDTEAMKRSFLFATTDYNNPANGETDDIFDSSGIDLFMLRLINAEDASDYKDYDITQYLTGTARNTSEFSTHQHTADCYHRHTDDCGYKNVTLTLHFEQSSLVNNEVCYDYSAMCPYCGTRFAQTAWYRYNDLSNTHECHALYKCGYEENMLMCESGTNIKAVLSAMFGAEINTFAEFPRAAKLRYTITIRDRAGNVQEYENADGNEITNFSIKAVVYYADISDEDIAGDILNQENNLNVEQEDISNVWTNVPYFKAGEFGYVEAWTIGYVPLIGFDFGEVGDKAVEEITGDPDKHLESNERMRVYNLGITSDTTYERIIPVSQAVKIATSFKDYNGIPYAAHYGYNEKNAIKAKDQAKYFTYFESNGTNIRIPIHYELTADGTKKTDGSDNYKWELQSADIIAYKGVVTNRSYKDKSSPLYVIWDTKLTEVHHRITHET